MRELSWSNNNAAAKRRNYAAEESKNAKSNSIESTGAAARGENGAPVAEPTSSDPFAPVLKSCCVSDTTAISVAT
jgi:hypothetical protein